MSFAIQVRGRVDLRGAFEAQPSSADCLQTEADSDLVQTSPDGIGGGGTRAIKRVEAVGVADVTGDGRSELVFSVTTNILVTRRISSTPGAIQFSTELAGPVVHHPNSSRFSSYLRFGVPGNVRFLHRHRDGLTSVARDTGGLVAWAGINDTKLYRPTSLSATTWGTRRSPPAGRSSMP